MVRRVTKAASTLGLAMLLLVVVYSYKHRVSAQAILSGSMSPAIKPGSLVISTASRSSEYRTGDIITMRLTGGYRELYVTHRISAVKFDQAGLEYLETKGDANTNGDPWRVLPSQVVGRVLLAIPFIGSALLPIKLLAIIAITIFSLLVPIRWCWEGVLQARRGNNGKIARKKSSCSGFRWS